MLAALSSIDLVISELRGAMAGLGNKLPAELDLSLQAVLSRAQKEHVRGDDTAEAAALVAAVAEKIDAYIAKQPAIKQNELNPVVAPVRAVVSTYGRGLRENAMAVVGSLLERFMSVESVFAGQATDVALGAMLKASPNNLQAVYATALAHEQLKPRTSLAVTLVRSLYTFPERFGVVKTAGAPQELDVVSRIAEMPGSNYKELALVASQFGRFQTEKPFPEVVAELKSELKAAGVDSTAVSRTVITNALLALFEDDEVGTAAMQVAIKRFYRAYNILSMDTQARDEGVVITEFKYKTADKTKGDTKGHLPPRIPRPAHPYIALNLEPCVGPSMSVS
jgi:acetyl-CoA carboxylase/biotin carboxylase 1